MNNLNDDLPALSINDRIVWISDNGPEYGNVRWLGKLPDLGHEWMAGVEFENPVGSGTGLYKDCQLFETDLNHASLVPIIGLIKASDFLDASPKQKNSNLLHDEFNRDLSNDNNRSGISNHNHLLRFRNKTNINDNGIANHASHKTQTNHQNPSIIRNIPIYRDAKKDFILNNKILSKSKQYNIVDQAPPLPEKPNRLVNHTNNNIINQRVDPSSEITMNLKKTNLNDNSKNYNNTNQPKTNNELVPMLPKPSFVVNPYDPNSVENLKSLLGKSKGIQGHNNSCYLDATLFSMFASTTLFDSLLYRPKTRDDIPEYKEIQRILRDEIVKPLRRDHFVSADQVMKFRTMLERSSSVDGLTDQEKDPEEFLTLLLGQILKAEPYLKLSSGLESFFYQLIVDKDENIILPTVQDLCEQSFLNSTVRLREIPPCLLLQMPRFGRQYKMYSRIMPSLRLDITDILDSAPRACGLRVKDCDNIAKYECKACFSEQSGRHSTRLSSVTYCANCFQAKHFGKTHTTGIEDHDKTKTPLERTPIEAISRYSNRTTIGNNIRDKEIPRIYMDLFAVLCIETSHYVCFVKCGDELESPWCFFDSMADRRGEQNGYNIPEVVQFDEFSFWTSEKGVACLLNNRDDKLLPEMAKRLICDAYLCFYQYRGLKSFR